MSDYRRFLKTLRRIPDDVVLSMATREYAMGTAESCVCGWAIRDELVAATGTDGGDAIFPVQDRLMEHFGGAYDEWHSIFTGVCHPALLSAIEMAFVERVDEAVRRATR